MRQLFITPDIPVEERSLKLALALLEGNDVQVIQTITIWLLPSNIKVT
jgi:hypothetical protein